ncbi:MAG: Formamidopyrimidine-DNA glycosylase [Acidimicrobiales bacterium]|nr:Formamidopyrimidine-DNA glycosylase [Acidimicrobiales bacterium]
MLAVPELPEIRAHAERLDRDFAGHVLNGFRALSFTALKTVTPPTDDAEGSTLERVTSRGKYLLLELSPLTFAVHLMQGGRLRPDTKKSPRPRGGLARWEFTDGRALLLSEAGSEKRAGVWTLPDSSDDNEPLSELGPEADGVSVEALEAMLRSNSGRVHGFLRDQTNLAGLGRRLANEACHRARLSPFANTSKLTDVEVLALHTAIKSTIDESLAYERSREDMSSSKERPGSVHNRRGESCPVCTDKVRSVEYSAYTVFYCPTCQTGGRILADNTTSRFLK